MTHRSNKSDKNRLNIKQEIKQFSYPKEFRISQIPSPEVDRLNVIRQLIENILPTNSHLEIVENSASNHQLEELLHLLANLATGVWRSRQKMLVQGTEQPQEDLRKAFRPLDATYQGMLQGGIELIDRVRQPYVIGLGEKVIAFEPSSGINRETIIETIKPAIYFRGQLLQQGEIIVGTPISEASSAVTVKNKGA